MGFVTYPRLKLLAFSVITTFTFLFDCKITGFILISLFVLNLLHKVYLYKTQKSYLQKNVVVTGGANGLGKMLCRRLLEIGANVVIWDIDEKSLDETKREFVEKFGENRVYTDVVDVSNENLVFQKAEEIKKQLKQIDSLINNAGIVSRRRLLDCPPDLVRKTMSVNTLAQFWTIKAFLPEMIERNSGDIVTISSIAGLGGTCGLECASKQAIFGMSEGIRLEMKRTGKNVDVLTVCPYYMKSPMFRGVKSPIIPFLNMEYVAMRIIKGMRQRTRQIILQDWLKPIIYGTRFFFPAWVADIVQHILKTTYSMDDFVEKEE